MWNASGGWSTATTNSSGSGNQQESSTTRRLSVDDELYMKNLLRTFSGNTTADLKGARENAIKDSAGAVTDIMNQFKDFALPEIMTKQQQSGGYGGSTTQLLTNDAGARAVAAGATVRLNAINQYENTALARSQQALSGMSTSLQALLAANEQTTKASAFSTKAKSRTDEAHSEGGGGM